MSGIVSLITNADLLSRRILAIDDEEANLLLIASLLEREGYNQVHCVSDPLAALDTYMEVEPHLVLLDLMMPCLDGFQLLEAFRRQTPPGTLRPVIVLTADTAIAARRRALSLGARDFVTKPFDVVEVALRIGNLLEMQLLYERLQMASNPCS